ncbi:MAG: DUF305 domain-containing protein [Woeseiaceae bacterium]|jgi:uncharacterized protein (DUF305 family)|nr:DUF305 domain-containing protein [Woeseiaceae bacterium]
MPVTPETLVRRIARAVFGLIVFAYAGLTMAQDVPIVLPGAPGEDVRDLSANEAVEIAGNNYSPDDVKFMQDMIPHHNQAVQMSELAADRTNNQELRDMAGRIDASQVDEIEFMADWLRDRGEAVPEATMHSAMHMSHEMAGMASPEDMARLAELEGTEFDRLFLTLMIAHHEGAVTMVENLLEQPGSAYDPVLFQFVNDVTNDQSQEIERMNGMLASLSTDPRAGLAAGFMDAGQAIMNMELLAFLPKPPGFFDPENPMGLPPAKPDPDSDEDADEDADNQDNEGTEWGERSPLLSFSNTDMAFADDKMVAGSYHGFNVYQLDADGIPEHFSSVVCPGGQGDVSVAGDLLIMSVEQTRGRIDCGLQGIAEDVSEERFRGIRIFDISDLRRPRQVGQVQTCRGSHTHSIVSADDEKIIVFNSGTGSVRDGEELEGCNVSPDERTSLFRIDVIEIPVAAPHRSRIISSPTVFADEETGRLAGLWQGGDHGDETQESRMTNQCHDITVFPSLGIAGGACSGNGIIFDISDPFNPTRMDEVVDPGFAYWHSATFNNDGTKVIFTDEWGGGGRPRCRTYDPVTWGADAIYDIVDGQLEFRSYYKLPAPQDEKENCVAHNGSVVPVPGRDIFAQAWYQGGMSLVDFTDSSNPVEIAYFDRGPIHEEHLITGGYWSTYWYKGRIYGTEITRGMDVFKLLPSEYLSANEVAAAELADEGSVFNPQTQHPVVWPDVPVVARAYIDQLNRDGELTDAQNAGLSAALASADDMLESGGNDTALADALASLAAGLNTDGAGMTGKRKSALADTLNGIADSVSAGR